jgi:hypothetical protein
MKKNISEWAHKLEELYNMIGDLTERAKVLKLWMGARPSIQKELWHSNLNPEIMYIMGRCVGSSRSC